MGSRTAEFPNNIARQAGAIYNRSVGNRLSHRLYGSILSGIMAKSRADNPAGQTMIEKWAPWRWLRHAISLLALRTGIGLSRSVSS